jgi:hypothetical protein
MVHGAGARGGRTEATPLGVWTHATPGEGSDDYDDDDDDDDHDHDDHHAWLCPDVVLGAERGGLGLSL